MGLLIFFFTFFFFYEHFRLDLRARDMNARYRYVVVLVARTRSDWGQSFTWYSFRVMSLEVLLRPVHLSVTGHHRFAATTTLNMYN